MHKVRLTLYLLPDCDWYWMLQNEGKLYTNLRNNRRTGIMLGDAGFSLTVLILSYFHLPSP